MSKLKSLRPLLLAAILSSKIPTKANAMPMDETNKYFQVASSATLLRTKKMSIDTKITFDRPLLKQYYEEN